MGLELGLNCALGKLAERERRAKATSAAGKARGAMTAKREDEERDLVVGARIWLALSWLDYVCVALLLLPPSFVSLVEL